MKNTLVFAPTAFLSFGATAANASVDIKKPFKNCAAVNAKHPGGVAKSAKSVNKGGVSTKAPFVDKKLYAKIKGMDRDKDGIACEK
jgi:hypothetical protein